MQFQQVRRQQFLNETHYIRDLEQIKGAIEMFTAGPASGDSVAEGWMISSRRIAANAFERLSLRYTAGEAVAPLRQEIEDVVVAYERYGQHIWEFTGDRNAWVFDFNVVEEYCQLMQVVGLCLLLHRRDLLPRIAVLQDGGNGSNGGADVIFEEFLIHVQGAEKRYQTEHACQIRPYENLFYALTEDNQKAQLKELELFLKHWYKDLAGTGWHDSHKSDDHGNQGGYYGYWSFEAGAAVLLLGIEDDSSLHKYLYYPKDMVAWARAHAALSAPDEKAAAPLRALAGEPCPREGWWLTPAKLDSRRKFQQGETMPEVGGDYGATIWQWDEQQ